MGTTRPRSAVHLPSASVCRGYVALTRYTSVKITWPSLCWTTMNSQSKGTIIYAKNSSSVLELSRNSNQTVLDNWMFSANCRRKQRFRFLFQVQIQMFVWMVICRISLKNSLTFCKKWLVFSLLWASTQMGRLCLHRTVSGCCVRIEVEIMQIDKPFFEKLFKILVRYTRSCNPGTTKNPFSTLGGDNCRLVQQE